MHTNLFWYIFPICEIGRGVLKGPLLWGEMSLMGQLLLPLLPFLPVDVQAYPEIPVAPPLRCEVSH